MSNLNSSKKAGSIPSKALYSRISYLHQAATYLATQQLLDTATSQGEKQTATASSPSDKAHQGIARRLVTDLRIVGQKSVIRMAPEIKRSICKHCDTVLIDGSTCTSQVENKSKGGIKPWADVLVRKCNACGFAKRFPMSSRQKRRPHRSPKVIADSQSMQLG
jgi:ribonuclease P protein subunit RPR2